MKRCIWSTLSPQSSQYTKGKITSDQRQLQLYCTGHCLFVSRYVQLICLVRLFNMALDLILMMTEGEENLCVTENRDYKTQWYRDDATPKGYTGIPKVRC